MHCVCVFIRGAFGKLFEQSIGAILLYARGLMMVVKKADRGRLRGGIRMIMKMMTLVIAV